MKTATIWYGAIVRFCVIRRFPCSSLEEDREMGRHGRRTEVSDYMRGLKLILAFFHLPSSTPQTRSASRSPRPTPSETRILLNERSSP